MDKEIEKWNDKIPKHWEVKRLGEICFTTSGGTPNRSKPNYYKGDIPWVKSGELNKGVIFDTEEKISDEAILNSSAKIFPKGTLLIALYGATIGKLAFLGIDAATNQAICGIFENGKIQSKYLYYYLFYKKAELVKQAFGGAQPNISQTILKNLPIPIPPLPEQEAIVAKIEELFSELEKGKEQLLISQKQLKVYRQSLLKAAFSGKLTHKDVKEGELPEGWKWVKVGDVCDCIVPNRDKPKSFTGNIRWVTTPDLTENSIRIKFSDSLLGLTQEEVIKYNARIIPIDAVIMTCVGKFGLCAIVEEPLVINQQLHAFLRCKTVNSKFLAYNIQNSKSFFEKKSTSTTIKYLNKENCNSMPLPVPSKQEQEQIVEILESKLTVCDKMEETIRQSLAQVDVLKQSILKKAFEGSLVGIVVDP
jgi:type I restriction enzyme S subunit